MQKHAILIRATNWKNRKLWYTFQTLFAQRRGFAHPTFYMKMNHFNIVFHMIRDQWQQFQ